MFVSVWITSIATRRRSLSHGRDDAFENYLSCCPGLTGIPLLYVIRKNDDPEPEGITDFVEKCISCAPLAGPTYESDKRQVHKMYLSALVGEIAEAWIKPNKKKCDGRVDAITLREHYAGKGNASRRIADAETLKRTLHYKSERAMPFTKILSKAQNMFNIFEISGEDMIEEARIRWLFDICKDSQVLAPSIAAMQTQLSINPGSISYTAAANQMTTAVNASHEAISLKSRGIHAVTRDGNESGAVNGIHKADGTIHTGYYKNWGGLTKDERSAVIAERIRLGQKGPTKKNPRKTSATKSKNKRVTKLKKDIQDLKRTVSALSKKGGDEKEPEDDETTSDAGNQFGGRASKKAKQT